MKSAMVALLLSALAVPIVAEGMEKKTAEAMASPRVRIETTEGAMVVELWPDLAPKTVENFLGYVKEGFFEGTIFHRIIPGFMIQGGGFTADMKKKPTRAPVMNEADNGRKNRRGTVAMARTSDPHSATAQFFVNVADNRPLDHTSQTPQGWGYAVFGVVVEGMDVADAIVAKPRGRVGPYGDVPNEPITIERVVLLGQEPAAEAAE